MAVQVAQSMNKARRDPLKYQAGPMPGRPQDPTLEQQAAAIAKKKAMAKGEEVAMPMFENALAKIKTAFSPASTAVAPPTQAAIASNAASTGTAGPLMQQVMGAAAPKAATGAAGSGAMASLGAAAPWLLGGYFGGKALGLFNQGGYVNGPLSLSKVRYKKSGGPVNEEIEVSYGGPLSKGV